MRKVQAAKCKPLALGAAQQAARPDPPCGRPGLRWWGKPSLLSSSALATSAAAEESLA